LGNNGIEMTEEIKHVDMEDTYRKRYRMQATGAGGNTIRTSVPSEVVEKAARKHGLLLMSLLKTTG